MAYDSISKAYIKLLEDSNHPLINVDGTMRPMHNTDGQLIHPSEEGIKNFHRWFGNSCATERPISSKQNIEHLRPQVLYHGTRHDFKEFRSKGQGTVSHTFGSYETERHGIFLTPHKEFASSFAMQGEHKSGQHVMPVYAKIENPLDITNGFQNDDIEKLKHHGVGERFMYNMRPYEAWEHFDGERGEHLTNAFKSAGYDGVFMSEDDPETGKARDVMVAFHPDQLKSAIGNSGKFAKTSKNLVESKK